MKRVWLKKGREKSVKIRHPWVFSGAVKRIEGSPEPGDTVMVVDHDSEFLSYAQYSPLSQIALRNIEYDYNKITDDAFWAERTDAALEQRKILYKEYDTDSVRLIFGEGDSMPGLIADMYGSCIVIQALSAGAEKAKNIVAARLNESLKPDFIYERGDSEMRKLEGLPEVSGALYGQAKRYIVIRENSLSFNVDIEAGHKTGYYLDQKLNRRLIRKYCEGKDVLDCFSYTGSFSVNSLFAGADKVTRLESSADALDSGRKNINLNRLDFEKDEPIDGDVFMTLRKFRDQGRSFGVVILDPPKFAPAKRNLQAAWAAYKDINLLAMKLLAPGGILITFSCSGNISQEEFQNVLAWAATDAGRNVTILERLYQSPDHPVTLSFPEALYLKGFICRVDPL